MLKKNIRASFSDVDELMKELLSPKLPKTIEEKVDELTAKVDQILIEIANLKNNKS